MSINGGNIKTGLLVIICMGLFYGCTTSEPPKKVEEKKDNGKFFDLTGGKSPALKPTEKVDVVRPDESKYVKAKPLDVPEYKTTPQGNPQVEQEPPFTLDEKVKKKRMFNFSDAPFNQVISLFAKEIGFQYILTDDIKIKTTLYSEMELTQKEVWDIFKQVMVNSKVYYTFENKLLNVKPISEAGQSTTWDGNRTNLGAQVFPLKHVDSKNMAAQLAPFVTKGVKVVELPSQNAILVMDSKDVIEKVRAIVSYMDRPTRQNWYKAVFPCHQVPSLRIAEELAQLLPILGIPVSINSQKDSPESMKIVSVDRMQLLIVASPTSQALDEAQRWIERLDTNDSGDQEQVYIYKILNSKAEYLTEVLSVIFALEGTTMVAESKTTENSQGGVVTTSKDITSKGKSTSSPTTAKTKSGGAASASADNSDIFSTNVRVFADGVNNSLVIRTKPRTFTMIKAILDRLDILPRQVLIQVLVVEIGLNDTTKFGVEFNFSDNNGIMPGETPKKNIGYSGGTNYKNLNPGAKDEFGSKFWLYNPKNPDQKFGYIQALAGMTNVKVLSSPQILVISHSQAKISVGNKVPLVNSEITNSQSVVTDPQDVSTNLVRNIQYQDTGIILKIIPQVTHSGQITLIMDQEVSEAVKNSTSNIDSPEIQSRTMQTTMMIRDGQTIIVGGMIKEKVTDNLDTIPVIKQIPFLRRLVGDTDYQKQRTEMLVLVTGTIITQESRLEELIKRYKQSVDLLQEYHKENTIMKIDPEAEKEQQEKRQKEDWMLK